MPPVLVAQHLRKSFGPRAVLEDVSLAIEEGERVGLIGSNGSGKSTLGKILSGIELSERGVVAPRRGLEVGYLAQEPVLDGDLTAYEEVERGLARWRAAMARHERVGEHLAKGDGDAAALLSEQEQLASEIDRLGGWDQGHRVRAMLEHLGIARPTQHVREMSGGERRRVALARLLVSRPGLAILDEPTNHLDADTAEWLEGHLVEEFTGALILITHDRYFLDAVVTRVFELDRGVLAAFEGNYASYLELKAERLELEARTESNRLNVLRREREWLSHSAPARTTKQKARINRAGSLETVVREAKRKVENTTFQVAGVRTGRRMLEAKDLGKSYGDKVLFRHLEFSLAPGERVGIIGRNGSGKTTLVRILLGEEKPDEGEVVVGPNTTIMYFDQHRAGLDETKNVYDTVAEGSDRVRLGDEWVNAHSYLERFLFDGAKQRQLVASLSGGERARLALAKMLRGGANLIVLDEPTNDLDLTTLATLEDLLTSFNGAVLVVTHDRYFLNRTVTSILSFEEGTRVVQYAGHYEDYRSQRASMGGCDLGFATVIQDDNAAELADLFAMTQAMGVELATSALHNAFQFHKADNFPYDRVRVAHAIEALIVALLKTQSVKNWFRAYLNLGLIQKVLGHDRLIPCTAGTDFLFIDPWADVYACNVRPDLYLGNLEQQSWDEIFQGDRAKAVRAHVAECKQNCWMVGSARTAMRNPRFTRLPKFKPLWWVLVNKIRVTLGMKIPFDQYIDYQNVAEKVGTPRMSFLGVKQVRRNLEHKDQVHYQRDGEYLNR